MDVWSLGTFRQSQIYARSGLNIDCSTLANWMGKVSFRLAPVVDHKRQAFVSHAGRVMLFYFGR